MCTLLSFDWKALERLISQIYSKQMIVKIQLANPTTSQPRYLDLPLLHHFQDSLKRPKHTFKSLVDRCVGDKARMQVREDDSSQ